MLFISGYTSARGGRTILPGILESRALGGGQVGSVCSSRVFLGGMGA